jgi:PHD/YefM family antitoxin component YafN of YafNO toxin-antitoxin module
MRKNPERQKHTVRVEWLQYQEVLMASATFTHQELQQNYEAAEKAARSGPVVITRDGQPRAVLIDIDQYNGLPPKAQPENSNAGASLDDLLAVPEDEYFDWEPKSLRGHLSPRDAREPTLLDLFDHPAFDNLPEDFDSPKVEFHFRPADFS